MRRDVDLADLHGVNLSGVDVEQSGRDGGGRGDDVDQTGSLVERRAVPADCVYGAPSAYLYVVDLSAASISAGVAVGSAWNSWATIPAMCGAAIDVPLMVLKVPMSSGPGPLFGARPVEQITRYGRHADSMSSPGADRSGQVDGSVAAPRDE